MIIEFSVGNFRSIKDIQTISFVAAPIVSKFKEVDESNTFQATDKLRLLKSLAIYGANASGKSNFIKAFNAFIAILQLSVKNEMTLSIQTEPFLLSSETDTQASFFQIVFILNGLTYRYGFEATKQVIVSEWLFLKNNATSKENSIFKRDHQKIDINHKTFKSIKKFKTLLNDNNPVFRKDSLLITALAAFNETLSKEIIDYFTNKFNILNGLLLNRQVRQTIDDELALNPILKNEVLDMLKESDTSIIDIKINEPAELNVDIDTAKSYNNSFNAGHQKIITTFHKKQNNGTTENVMLFLDAHASEGTKKMYEIYPFIWLTLKGGHIMVVDEFDARFHPRLSQKIIDLFNNPRTNPNNAQLLVASHDTNLLSAKTFRRDQILFVEKDRHQASHIYSLAEFKGVRNDASFEKDYLDGRYGAVPFLNNFPTMFENQL